MRRLMVGVLVGTLALGPVTNAFAGGTTQGQEVEYSALSALASVFYTPFKLVFAVGGLAVGALAGTLTGGDQRAAYAFWVPAAGGDYFVKPNNLAQKKRVQILGSDYSDTPSLMHMDADSAYVSKY